MANNIKGVILISRQKIEFANVQTSEIYLLDIPSNVVRDLDVLNKEELAVYIKAFIDHYKIPSSDLILMLADDVIYEKDIPPLVGTQYDEALKSYLEKIPFERVSNKIIHSDKGTKIISANQDLFMSIKESFEKHNFHVLGILPMRVVERNALPQKTLDPEIIRDIISGFDAFRQNYAITAEEPKKIKSEAPLIEKEMKAPKSKREFILIGFFILLIAVFAFMFYNYQKDSEKIKNRNRNKAIPTLTPSRQPFPTVTPNDLLRNNTATPAARIETALLTVQIIGKSDNKNKAAELKSLLAGLGLSDISEEENSSLAPSKTTVIFSGRVPDSLKRQINDAVTKISSETTVQEVENSKYDLIIILGGAS